MRLSLHSTWHIYHCPKLEALNATALDSYSDAIIVLSANAEKKHEQIRVVPFNIDITDKKHYHLLKKLQFFKREVRNLRAGGDEVAVAAEDVSVINVVPSFFTGHDGLTDEFNDFVIGFNTKPVTGYENNFLGFFGDNFLAIKLETLPELISGLNPQWYINNNI